MQLCGLPDAGGLDPIPKKPLFPLQPAPAHGGRRSSSAWSDRKPHRLRERLLGAPRPGTGAPSDPPSTHPRSGQPPPRSPIPVPRLPAPRCGLRVPPAPVPLRGHRPLFPFRFPFPSPLRRRSAPAPPARSCGESSAPDPRGSPKALLTANGSDGGKRRRRRWRLKRSR